MGVARAWSRSEKKNCNLFYATTKAKIFKTCGLFKVKLSIANLLFF